MIAHLSFHKSMARKVNLVPMAGAGQRFVDAGFTVPKPLIPVAGIPIVVHAARSLPPADLWIFVCRAEHVRDAKIDEVLKSMFSPCEVIVVDRLTEGQASTCLLARHLLLPDDELTIGACDNAMTWDVTPSFSADDSADFYVWTFRRNPAVQQDPRMYGWVAEDSQGNIDRVSVKIPLPGNPMDNHAVVGAFSFRRAADFLDACDRMITANSRIKNEFYVDNAVNFALAVGLKGKVFEVDRYICWGTPLDLAIYEYWRGYFSKVGC